MIKFLALAFSLFAVAEQSAATCIVEPIDKQVSSADTVFIATITSAKVEDPEKALQHGKYYRVTYTFEVRKVIKGDPSRVTSLYSQRLYSDPLASDRITLSEDWPIAAGDSVVVVADKPGPAQPGACDTTVEDFARYARDNDL